RVEGLLDPAHHRQLDRVAEPPELVAFELADTVLGADRPTPFGDEIVNERANRLALGILPLSANGAWRCENMKMHIAVTEMSECDGSGAGEARFDGGDGGRDEIRHSRHGDRNVMLHGRPECAFGRSDLVA